jgi:uncharacterized membrane protein YgaE (UPF0421/DUF939 family)
MTKNHFLLMLSRLEEIIKRSPKIMGRSLIITDEALEVLEKMRNTLPSELKEAQELIKAREKIMQQAEEEAENIKNKSIAEAKKLLSEHHLIKLAEEESRAIKSKAYEYGQQVEIELAQYAQGILEKLEQNLIEALRVVHKAIDEHTEQNIDNDE